MNDLKRPVIGWLSAASCLKNKPASCFIRECTVRRKRERVCSVSSVCFSTGAVITCPRVLHAVQTQVQRIKSGRFRGPWRHNGLVSVRLFSLHKRRTWSMEQILYWFLSPAPLSWQQGFDGIFWFPNEDVLLIIQLERFTVVCLWRPFKSTTCPSDSCKLDLKKHTLKLATRYF